MTVSYSVADLTQLLRCPGGACGDFEVSPTQLGCKTCGEKYQVANEIVIMLKAKK
jgi:uncharacterized protein YbaR (Trm112 family)